MEEIQTEVNVGRDTDKKPVLPFSFMSQDVSTKSSIPSYTRGPGVMATQSQQLIENVSERSARPSLFFMSSQPQDSFQRTGTLDSQKSQRKLTSRFKLPKNEEKPSIISRNFDAAAPQAHKSFFSGLSRQQQPTPAVEHEPSAFMSVGQVVRPFSVKSVIPKDYTLPKPPVQQEEHGAESIESNAPMFRISHQPDASQSPPSRARRHGASRSRSRSSSVVAHVGRGEEDISAMMMRCATEVRNVRAELEEQRRKVSYLYSELETTSKEKEELSHRLEATKTAARKGLETCSVRYDDLKSAFESLKAQSQMSFSVVDEAKTRLSDLKESQKVLGAGVAEIQLLFDEHGKCSETKALIRELEEECLNTQQVAQLLREKLQNAGGDLAEARSRIAELESLQLSEAQAFKLSSINMLHMSEKFPEMVSAMKQKELETVNALQSAADAEVELNTAKEKIAELQEVVAAQDIKLESARHLEQQNTTLRTELDDKVSRLTAAESAQLEGAARLLQSTEIMQEQRTQLLILQASVTAHKERQAELELLSQVAESQAKEHRIATQKLQEELRQTGIREHVALTKAARAETLENELAVLRKDLRANDEKSQNATKQLYALQERFDDQSVTLRLTKQLSGDLQERLLTSEAAFAAKLEALSGKMNLEVAILKEQKSNMQTNLERAEDQAKESSRIAHERLQITIADFEKQLSQQDAHHTRLIDLEERRGNQLEKDLAGAKNAAVILEERLSALGVKLAEMKERLEECKGPSLSQTEAVACLKVRVRELESANEGLVQREKIIDSRYREGDLSDEEKAFVNSLIQMSQSIHEQELVSKGNELRRRDNMIASLHAKIGVLESTLARHLQAKTKADANSHNQSMIDLQSFILKSSPISTTPAVVSSGTTAPTAAPPPVRCVSPQNINSPPPAAKPFDHEKAATRIPPFEPTFTRLATDSSDEMIESEDDIPITEALASVSALGKRDGLSSPVKDDDTTRPIRRLRVAKNLKPEVSEHKSESVAKRKTRKRG